MRLLAVSLVLATLFVTGALGDPALADEVRFDAIQRAHFDAAGVAVERGAPSDAPLIVRVERLGDASDADLTQALDWLREHANVEVVDDANGAPLYLTRGDLAATSGRGTLGATVARGMAVEVRDPRIAPCVLAHEILHFVGLKHVEERGNIMYPHCGRDALERAELSDAQRAQLATLETIVASTPEGVRAWVSR